MDETANGTTAAAENCAECGTTLDASRERRTTDDGVFCLPCFGNLTAQIQQAIAAQGQEVNYSMAVAGGLIGGALGAAAWWLFTVMTKISFGLVAVVIGIAVGKGVVLLAGQKRAQGLQIVSVVISLLSFFYASYLVNRSFILQEYAGQPLSLPWVPGPLLLFQVVKLGFGIMDLVFLGIVAYQAWVIPAPLKLRT